MDKTKAKRLINNTIMMYVLSITKLIVPIISLPYLTRVLSIDIYGSVSFVKSMISYLQILVDFGFVYSGTKDLIDVISNKKETSKRVGDIFYAQLLLSFAAIIIMMICSCVMNVLDGFELYSMLSVVSVVLSIFLFEYVFRAAEKMGVITIRFVIMKVLALILTLVFVKGDKDVILIPVFDIISSMVAVIPVFFQMKKLGVCLRFSFRRIRDAFLVIKRAFEYFVTSFLSVAFLSFNTIIIGLVLTKSDVAHWSLAMQFVNAVLVLYNPIISSLYPIMTKNKNLNIIHKILLIYAPIILIGCVLVLCLADKMIIWTFTNEYSESARIFKLLLPPLVMAFPIMLYGAPCLGVINQQRLNIVITLIAFCGQILGVGVLLVINAFSFNNLVIICYIVGIALCLLRIIFVYKNRKMFDCLETENNA